MRLEKKCRWERFGTYQHAETQRFAAEQADTARLHQAEKKKQRRQPEVTAQRRYIDKQQRILDKAKTRLATRRNAKAFRQQFDTHSGVV